MNDNTIWFVANQPSDRVDPGDAYDWQVFGSFFDSQSTRLLNIRYTMDVPEPGLAILALGGLAGLLLVALTLRAIRARRPMEKDLTDDQVRAVRLYTSLSRKLGRIGVDCRGKTVEEVREAIQDTPWGAAGPVLTVLSAYNAVRFGARPLSPRAYATLQRLIRSLRTRELPRADGETQTPLAS